MTIEKLLNSSADQLEALSTEELNSFFKPYLVVTRPELCAKPQSSRVFNGEKRKQTMESKKELAMEILKQHGVNVKRW